MDIRVQTALIAAVVSIVGTLLAPWVKNRFDKQARVEEWTRKRDDWLLEKRARDAEEVVTALERVLKGLSYTYNIVSREQGYMSIYAEDRRRLVVGHFTQEKLQRLNAEINQIMTKHTSWFEYDIRRLSIWFVEDERVYKELQDLGERVTSMYNGLGMQLSTVALRWDEQPS